MWMSRTPQNLACHLSQDNRNSRPFSFSKTEKQELHYLK